MADVYEALKSTQRLGNDKNETKLYSDETVTWLEQNPCIEKAKKIKLVFKNQTTIINKQQQQKKKYESSYSNKYSTSSVEPDT